MPVGLPLPTRGLRAEAEMRPHFLFLISLCSWDAFHKASQKVASSITHPFIGSSSFPVSLWNKTTHRSIPVRLCFQENTGSSTQKPQKITHLFSENEPNRAQQWGFSRSLLMLMLNMEPVKHELWERFLIRPAQRRRKRSLYLHERDMAGEIFSLSPISFCQFTKTHPVGEPVTHHVKNGKNSFFGSGRFHTLLYMHTSGHKVRWRGLADV